MDMNVSNSHLWREYTLQHDLTIPIISDELNLVPTSKDARRNLANPLVSQKHGLLCSRIAICSSSSDVLLEERERRTFMTGFEPEASHEDRIRDALLYANTVSSWAIRDTVVVWTPSDEHRVYCDHERGESVRLGASEE